MGTVTTTPESRSPRSIEDAAWIADTGRFNEALSVGTSKLNEVEPVSGDVFIGLGSVVDVEEWIGNLPREVK